MTGAGLGVRTRQGAIEPAPNQMPAPLGRVVVGRQTDPRSAPALTPRQLEIVRLLATGLPYKAVAASLGISVSTVKTHVMDTYRRVGADSILDALCVLGWLHIPPEVSGFDRRRKSAA